MANDNKKINDLASEGDDDTSEFAALSEDALSEADVEFEADAATHVFEAISRNRGADNDSISALRSEMQERDTRIDRLEFELQQFRSRAKGLEKELEAREVVTGNLAGELETERQTIAKIRAQLIEREQRVSELEVQLGERDHRVGEAERELEETRKHQESAMAAFGDLEHRHTAALGETEVLRSELAEERSQRKRAEDGERSLREARAALEQRQRESGETIASLREYIEGRKARWEQQERDLATRGETLREQQRNIERLTKDVQYAIARLHSEKTGREQAESRLEALEADAARLRETASGLYETIEERDAAGALLRSEIETLRQSLEHTTHTLLRTEEDLSQARAGLERDHAELAALRDETASAGESTAGREALLLERRQTIEELEAAISKSESELENERAAHQELEKRFAEEQATRQALGTEYETAAAETAKLRSELRELRAAAADFTELEEGQARLVGQVAAQAATIEKLRQQLTKTEAYADTLRDKLQRRIADAEAQAAKNRSLESNVARASARIDELSAALERERAQNKDIGSELEKVRREFEEEIRKVRFELDEAQGTIAENRGVNEQLTADLIDSTGRRRSLEAKLSEFDEAHRSELQALADDVARLKLQLEDSKQKLEHKDAALKALLAEFASKPKLAAGTDEAAGEREAEEAVRRWPARKTEDAGGADRDRVTRLLVGTIDGQKLRFPLFKDKLTIGRTGHNDIQIRAQYISRRHAVVITEDEQTRIVDWGSKNGVYVNGIRITEQPLRNGDLVTVGTAEFVFEERPKR